MAQVSIVRSALVAAAFVVSSTAAFGATISVNTGSLGAAANGTNADNVTKTTGVVAGNADNALVFNNTDAARTVVAYQPALNPSSSSPFSIEFWAKPTASDNDDAPVANRVSSGNRSGWAFFQRAPGTGWNFRAYNGNGSGLYTDITGGTSTLNAWSHVVATYSGSTFVLYVNGAQVATSATAGVNGTYNPNTTVPLTIGTLADAADASPYAGALDEIAFYGSALSATQVAAHFATVNSVAPSAYYDLVKSDGALLQLSNAVPEPTSLAALAAGGVVLARRRRRA